MRALTWWRRPAEPREGSVCLTRKRADGRIWARCLQTGPFLLGRFAEGLRVPGGERGRVGKLKIMILIVAIKSGQEYEKGKSRQETVTF